MKKFFLATIFAAGLTSVGVSQVHAAFYNLSTLVSFNYSNGQAPVAGLIADASGNIYGTTVEGGANNYGTLFKMAAGTHDLTTLVTFNYSNGANPWAGRLLADAGGNFYGTTFQGGATGAGTVFEVTAGTHALTTLASFNYGSTGAFPQAGLIADAHGNMYGTTNSGGANGYGTIFEVAAGTHALTTLVAFNGSNGKNPVAGLHADARGNLYGTTNSGGASGYGTVFEMDSITHALTTLVSFNGSNGASPYYGDLIADASGNLYGTTYSGGTSGYGTVFEVDAVTHALTTLVSFDSSNGAYPESGLIADANGNLYGTTTGVSGTGGVSTIFEVDAATHALTTLASFDNSNSAYPTGGLLADAFGNFYGTTLGGGGANGYGTIFELSNLSFSAPEPATLALLALGATTLLVRRKRSR